MLGRQKEHIFPDTLSAEEHEYWCYVKETSSSSLEVIPVSYLSLLLPTAIVWTPWAGAAWESRWRLIGEAEGHIGAIRFAGTKLVKGQQWWAVDLLTLNL